MMLADLSLIDIVLSLLSAALTFFLIVYYLHHVVIKIPACLLRDFLCHLVYWLDGKKTQYSNPEKKKIALEKTRLFLASQKVYLPEFCLSWVIDFCVAVIRYSQKVHKLDKLKPREIKESEKDEKSNA